MPTGSGKETIMELPSVSIKKILYTTDLSESARFAFAYAASLAEKYGAEITILHVLMEDAKMESGIVGYIGEDRWKKIKDQNAQEARQALIGKKRENIDIRYGLEHFAENMAANLENPPEKSLTDEVVIRRGNPVDQIIEVAEQRNPDLIVMGTHGHGIIADAMMGSTARRVIRRSKIPVLVIRLPDEK